MIFWQESNNLILQSHGWNFHSVESNTNCEREACPFLWSRDKLVLIIGRYLRVIFKQNNCLLFCQNSKWQEVFPNNAWVHDWQTRVIDDFFSVDWIIGPSVANITWQPGQFMLLKFTFYWRAAAVKTPATDHAGVCCRGHSLDTVGLHHPVEHPDHEHHQCQHWQEAHRVKYKCVCIGIGRDKHLSLKSWCYHFIVVNVTDIHVGSVMVVIVRKCVRSGENVREEWVNSRQGGSSLSLLIKIHAANLFCGIVVVRGNFENESSFSACCRWIIEPNLTIYKQELSYDPNYSVHTLKATKHQFIYYYCVMSNSQIIT